MKAKKTYKGGGLLDKLKEKVSSLKSKQEAPKEFDKTGYKFLGKSDDLNAIAHRKKNYSSTHGGPQEYKFTKDSEGKTNMYVKMGKGGIVPKYKKDMPSYSKGGMMEMLKKYKQGGKLTEGLKALFAEKPELKKKFGYAKYGMKITKK